MPKLRTPPLSYGKYPAERPTRELCGRTRISLSYIQSLQPIVPKNGRSHRRTYCPSIRLTLVWVALLPQPETNGSLGSQHASNIITNLGRGCLIVRGRICWLSVLMEVKFLSIENLEEMEIDWSKLVLLHLEEVRVIGVDCYVADYVWKVIQTLQGVCISSLIFLYHFMVQQQALLVLLYWFHNIEDVTASIIKPVANRALWQRHSSITNYIIQINVPKCRALT